MVEIRWIQRLNHFSKACAQLAEAVELSRERPLSKLETQGLIQAFEFTFELAWNTVKDYFQSQGETALYGSRDTFRLAFRRGLIVNGELWMDMIASRTLTSHTYNADVAEKIAAEITGRYYSEFVALESTLIALRNEAS